MALPLAVHSKEVHEVTPTDLKMVGLKEKDVQGRTIYKAGGCEECKNVGYRGRKGIFELLEMNSTIRDLAFNSAPTLKLRRQARMDGMRTLQEDGLRKVLEGITTVDEILRITHRDDISAL